MTAALSLLPGTALAGLLLYLWNRWRKAAQPVLPPPNVSYDVQALPAKGQPGVYRCGYLQEGEGEIVERAYPEVATAYDTFLRGLEVSNNGPCLGYRADKDRPYTFLSYTDVFRSARDFGSALLGVCGLKPSNDVHVGIYAKNSPEWFISALGCLQQSIVIVPLYDTLGAEAATFIVQQAEIRVIVVDKVDKVERLLADRAKLLPTVEHMVLIEVNEISAELREKAEAAGVQLYAYTDFLRQGQLNPQKLHKPKEEDTYIICYTSGTTGLPKGVIITHKNLVANHSSFALLCQKFQPSLIGPQMRLISYLPLSHMMEQLCHWCVLCHGGSVGYFQGSVAALMSDIQTLGPTIFPTVPRLLNRLYDSIQSKLAKQGPLVRALYNFAYAKKLEEVKAGYVRTDSFWDKLVFNKIQKEVGGRVALIATGSAPIAAEVLESIRVVLGCTIIEGYGQTECTALAAYTWPGDWRGGHCGGPSSNSYIKLSDVPELDYFAKDNKGEIMVKGPSVTQGYYRDPVKTAELFDEEGFLHTGDVGWLQPNGTIKIIDRKKHIFKLAQGEYVAPEKIENIYSRTPVVQQIYVDGNSLERFLLAIVVPEPTVFLPWVQANVDANIKDLKEACQSKKAADYVLAEITRQGKENKLNSIEQVKAVHLHADPFTVENGLLTPTLKAKRPVLRKLFADRMAQLYKDNPMG